MKNTEKKEFKELSEEQLQEVTGGNGPYGYITAYGYITVTPECIIDNCPSMRFDPQCNCLG